MNLSKEIRAKVKDPSESKEIFDEIKAGNSKTLGRIESLNLINNAFNRGDK